MAIEFLHLYGINTLESVSYEMRIDCTNDRILHEIIKKVGTDSNKNISIEIEKDLDEKDASVFISILKNDLGVKIYNSVLRYICKNGWVPFSTCKSDGRFRPDISFIKRRRLSFK